MGYAEVHERSLVDAEAFWAEAAEDIHWYKKWDKVFDDSNPPFYRWFTGGEVNTCYNAVDRHVEEGRADQLALIYDTPITGEPTQKITYGELLHKVAHFAGALKAQGVEKGDRVIIYMPMVPEATIAMLACARIGAVHSVVFGGFAPNELATRIEDAKPKLMISASCGVEPSGVIAYKPLLDEAIDISSVKPDKCIIFQRSQVEAELIEGRDIEWNDSLKDATPADCVPLAATDPLYILYTSGTTGEPKGVVRDNGGHLVALKWSMHNVYGVAPGEVFWAASDVGWGGGAFLHHVCAAHPWLHHHPLRGQARGHAGCGRFLAHHLRARGEGFLHRAHGVSRHQARRSGRRSHEELRPQLFPHPVPGGGALGLGHDSVGRGASEGSRHRSLLADRDRLADAGEPHGHRAYARQVRLSLEAGARL